MALNYNYFRDYDGVIGRYIQSDPIGLSGGLNTYGYALQNPVCYADPTGQAVPAVVAAGVWAYRGYQAYGAYRTARTAATAAAVVSGALTPAMNQNQDDRGKVVPFPPIPVDTGDTCSAPNGGGLCNLTQQIRLSGVTWNDPDHDGLSIPGLTRWRCEYSCPDSGRMRTRYVTNRLGCLAQIPDAGL